MNRQDEAGRAWNRWRRLVTAFGASAAVLAAFAAPADAATTTFTREVPTAIPTSGNANPYPSSISVSGLTGSVTDVTVTFNNFSHSRPHDFGMVLVAPGGQGLALMDCITDQGASSLFVTLSDAGPAAVPNDVPLDHGEWRPANYCSFTTDYPAPGPGMVYSSPAPRGSATFGSTFGGTDPNGTWDLFITDFVPGEGGQIPTWSLSITTPDPAEPPPPPAPEESADTSAPDTTITQQPKDKTKKTSATFAFASTEPGSTFQCAVDGQSLKVPCTSPYTAKVKKGKHTFQVRAVDSAGNADSTPASDAWKVKKKK
jgi:subtilisin-like proprotein convertase family protein